MADFSRYVHSFREPKSYSLGPAIRELITQRQSQQQIDDTESRYARTRADTQTEKATEFASKQAEAAYKTQFDRYQKRLALIAQARAAAQGGHYNDARALIPTITELGGTASESGDPEAPDFRFEAGSEPTRGPVDIDAARRQMYQGAPPGTQANQPFLAPGFGPNGQRNPFAPQALPGAPAAALQTPPAPSPALPGAAKDDPPPGAARSTPPPGAVWLPPGMDPGQTPAEADLAVLNAAEGEPEPGDAAAAPSPAPAPDDLTGPNPYDPYVIRTSEVQADNERRLAPFFQGLANAAPSRYESQIEEFGKGARALNLSPEETLEATRGWSDQMVRMFNSEVTAEGQAGRAQMTQAARQSVQDDREKKDARAFANKIIQVHSLQDTKKKSAATREAGMLAKRAETNGSVANALIETLYKMRNTGVMTDVDFSRTESGIQSIVGAIVNNTLKQFIDDSGGLHPGIVRRIQELIRITEEAHRATMGDAMGSLYEAYKTSDSPAARKVYEQTMRVFFSDMLPEEFKKVQRPTSSTDDIPTVSPEDEQATMRRMAEEEGGVVDNLGVFPVPTDRHPTGTNKTVDEMTPAERRARAEELLRKANEP